MIPIVFHRPMSTVESANIPTVEYKLYRLDQSPNSQAKCLREHALNYFKNLYTIRRMETTAGNMYKEKIVRGFCHLYTGQEAIAVGIEAAISKEDSIITSYRCHAFCYTRGNSVHSILAELAGKSTGATQGKGGSMHIYGNNFYGGNGIVGAQIPLGTGIAFANKFLGKPNVCLALYGDGAANQGQIFEAFNLSKIHNLPIIFICENNHYGMGTAAHRSSANTAYYTRGDSVPGIWVSLIISLN
ncbi:unnamed protein product [Protopolystoma xenopodis]|uniref:Dehydrogenase E1 component domain-containing protein n=1 Tax=Protopolystoma xenopodis TaxID=117903 RepID=A0A448WWS5_9PLAT|nr:unnamed protein product [Protopolystoma xenopodis]